MSETKNYIQEWIFALKHTKLSQHIDRIIPNKSLKVVYKRKLTETPRVTYEEVPFEIDVEIAPDTLQGDVTCLGKHLIEATIALEIV